MPTLNEVFETTPWPDLDASILDAVLAVLDYHTKRYGETPDVLDVIRWLDGIRAYHRVTRSRNPTGFALQCPYCFGDEADLIVNLHDLSTVHCMRCAETFTPAQAHAEIAEALEPWARLIEWMRTAPVAVSA